MEKFSTLLTENYNTQQELVEYIKTLVNDPSEDMFRVDVGPDEATVSFKPNFGASFAKIGDVLKKISGILSDYPLIKTARTDKNEFTLLLKK